MTYDYITSVNLICKNLSEDLYDILSKIFGNKIFKKKMSKGRLLKFLSFNPKKSIKMLFMIITNPLKS